MIETVENAIQIVVLGCCVGMALHRGAGEKRTGAWVCLNFYYGSRLLGDLYWQMCLFYFGSTPAVSIIPDLSWLASIIFMYLLVRMEIGTGKISFRPVGSTFIRRYFPYLAPVYTFANAALYMQWGKYLSNTIYASIEGLLLFVSLRGLLEEREERETGRRICMMGVVFCLLEHCVWTASCFWDIKAMEYSYYAFDTLMTVCFPLLIPFTGHLARRQLAGERGDGA